MKQTAVDFIVKELDILHRERKEKVIDAETFFKHKGVLIQLTKEKEKEQAKRQLFIGKVSEIIGAKKTIELLKEVNNEIRC